MSRTIRERPLEFAPRQRTSIETHPRNIEHVFVFGLGAPSPVTRLAAQYEFVNDRVLRHGKFRNMVVFKELPTSAITTRPVSFLHHSLLSRRRMPLSA